MSQRRIVLASNNAGKLKEFQKLLAPLHYDVTPQKEFNIPDAEETGKTFIENALLKARHASELAELPALADDSGLVISTLGGEPGIYSARYAGEHGNSERNIKKVLRKLEDASKAERLAYFHCTLAWLQHPDDPEPIIAQANWYGRILTATQGEAGFGYDPIFYLDEYQCSAAELPAELKNRISHRGQAVEQLKNRLLICR